MSFIAALLLVLLLLMAPPAHLQSHHEGDTSLLTDVLEHDSPGYLLWNITVKYSSYAPSKLSEECVYALLVNDTVAPAYVAHSTLQHNTDFLRRYILQLDDNQEKSDVLYLWGLSVLQNEMLRDYELYHSTALKVGQFHGKESVEFACPSEHCPCPSDADMEEFEEVLAELKVYTESLGQFVVLGVYVEPCVRLSIMLVALLLNGSLLMMFAREKSVRTETHALIFSAVLSNVCLVTVYMPLNYFYLFFETVELYEPAIFAHIALISIHALTIFCLHLQRYNDVSRVLRPSVGSCRISSFWRTFLYLISVWGVGVLLAFLTMLVNYEVDFDFEVTVCIWLWIIVLSLSLAVVNIRSAAKFQRVPELARSDLSAMVGSRVILALSLLYYLYHVPFLLFLGYQRFGFQRMQLGTVSFIFHALFCTYSCASALVLYRSSGTYRRYMNKYLFRCWYIEYQEARVAMSSLQEADRQVLL